MGMGDDRLRRQNERDWLALEVASDGSRGDVVLDDIHVTFMGRMYGGAGLSLTSMMIEEITGRRLLWATTQFVGAPARGDRVSLRAEVGAAGKRISQVFVRAYVADRLMFQGMGAAGETRDDIEDRAIPRAPLLPPPEECRVMRPPVRATGDAWYLTSAERRFADRSDGPVLRWWMRFPGRCATSPSTLAMFGDFVPAMVMEAIGEAGAGTSLDNTIRAGRAPEGEWVLVDGQPEMSVGGYGHGTVLLWGEHGHLAGVASQTSSLWHQLN
jgi:acyl-CoA thioesterase